MKKEGKVLLLKVLLISGMLFGSLITNAVFAMESVDWGNDYPLISAKLQSLFEGNENIIIYNNDDEDITKQFYYDNYTYYENKNFNHIIANFITEANCIIEELPVISPYYMTNVSKESSLCYTILKRDGYATSFEFAYYACGRVSYNDNTGKYTSISQPGIRVYAYPAFSDCGYKVTADYGIINNGYNAYYKNFVITLWGQVIHNGGAAKIYYDPIKPNVNLYF